MANQYRIDENDANMIIVETIRRAISEDEDRLIDFMKQIVPKGTKVNYDPDTYEIVIKSNLPAHDIFAVDLAKYAKEELR